MAEEEAITHSMSARRWACLGPDMRCMKPDQGVHAQIVGAEPDLLLNSPREHHVDAEPETLTGAKVD
jgi:hypothetical protein